LCRCRVYESESIFKCFPTKVKFLGKLSEDDKRRRMECCNLLLQKFMEGDRLSERLIMSDEARFIAYKLFQGAEENSDHSHQRHLHVVV
jgi:hypothetical protein